MKKIHFVLAVMLLIVFSTPAIAQIRPGAFSLSPFVGGFWFDGGEDLKQRPVYGLRLGQDFTKNWGAELLFDYVRTEYEARDLDTNVYNYRIEGLYHFMPESRLVPFLAAGLGGMSIDYIGDKRNQNRFVADYGAGVKYFITDWLALRGDVRHVLAFGSVHSNLEYTVGLTFYFGGAKPAPVPVAEAKPVEEPIRPEPVAPAVIPAPPVEKDSDQDGVPDYLDKCPGTPPGVGVDQDGCPPDSDKDGVPDYLDKCPGTPIGTRVDRNGCPIPPRKVSITLAIEFDTGKADIKSKYHDEIAKVADFMKKYPTAKGLITGHTDNVGGVAMNQELSQRRAESVINYLVQEFGIDPARLSAKGYGMSRPIADNKTAEGRQQNRRIEAIFDAMVVEK